MNGVDFLRRTMAIVWKDLLVEMRAKEMLLSVLVFAFMVLVVFSFAFNPVEHDLTDIFAGIMWVAFLFAGTLGLNRSFQSERQNGALQGLILAPVDRAAIFLGKFISNTIFMLAVELVLTPVFVILLNYRFGGSTPLLVAALVLGTVGFTAVGTFLAALASNTRASEVLLPVLLFPLLAPVIIGAVRATEAALAGKAAQAAEGFKLLGAFDVIFLALPFVLFEYMLES